VTTNAFPRIGVLFVCTGNQCRSPIAAALLRARLDERGSPLTVESSGFMSEGVPPPREALETMWAVGVDLSGHRSRPLSPTTIGAADLIVGMTRQHVVELTVMAPPEWERAFTFADLLRRAETVGPRQRIEAVREWVRRLHAGRLRSSLTGLPLSEDVSDPMGGRPKDYQRTREQLVGMTTRLAELLSPA
jgi:protein-tyrosine phosphatase